MLNEMIFAGFGGQGILSMGKLLAYVAMLEGRDISWMPSYGPEMRGGTANCIVNVGDSPISSPVVEEFDVAVVFNLPSLKKFEPKVKTGGILIVESSTIKDKPVRNDIRSFLVPSINIATELGNKKVMNMVALGALIGITRLVSKDTLVKAIKDQLPKRHHHLVPLNELAIEKGMEIIKNA